MADQRRLSVFITGATGFIGQSAALALRNRGHHVTALVRSPEGEAAKMLRQHEIVTVVGDITNTASFEHMLASFDVLVSVAQSAPAKQGSEATISAFLGASAASSTPKTVIYTSGCLIYGHRGEELLTEDDDLHACPEAVQWRIAHEQRVVKAEGAHGIVLRPGFVYGRSGSYVGDFFSAARKGVQNVAGDGSNHWSTVHVEDLARAYVMIAESGASVAGRIFNVSDHAFPTTKELALAASAACGFTGEITHVPTSANVWMLLCSLSAKLDSSAIREAVGWRPLLPPFLDDVQTYYQSWLAHNHE